jgi:hypothetical protein
MTRTYTLTLPLGTEVEVSIPGPVLIAQANALYLENGGAGWTHEDCLTMRALSYINGVEVNDPGIALSLDTKEYLVLKNVVTQLVTPTTEQLEGAIKTLTLVTEPITPSTMQGEDVE